MLINKKLVIFVPAIFILVVVFFINSSIFAAVQSNQQNIIANHSLEIDSNNDNIPDQWFVGQWGDNNAIFTYPVAGFNGGRAARVDITSYKNGDAKWYFADVPVIAGQQYNFQDRYLSTTGSFIVARYTNESGIFSYVDLGLFPATSVWRTADIILIPPVGAASLTVFHLIAGAGSLTVDGFSLTTGVPADNNIFDKGFVSLTFDDGWRSQFASAKPILDAAGLRGTFYIISQVTQGLIPQNGSLEKDADHNNIPDQWGRGQTGRNNAIFTYPVAGNGGRAARVDITSYKNGDAKWYFADVPVIADKIYNFQDEYISTVTSYIVARVTLTSGKVQNIPVATVGRALSRSTFQGTFYVPPDAKSLTVFHMLKSKGSLTIDNVSLGIQSYMTDSQVLSLQATGHEIGDHTRTHPALASIPAVQAWQEISGARSELLGIGATSILSIAYPFGSYNDQVKQTARDAGLTSGRSVIEGFNTKVTDKLALLVQLVTADTTIDQIESWINTAVVNKTWLILVFHQVDEVGAPDGTTSLILGDIVNYLKTNNVPVRTVTEGALLM